MRGNASALTAQQRQGQQLFFSPQTDCSVCHDSSLLGDGSFRFIGVVPQQDDDGRFAVTGLAQDLGRFKVPGLRNVALQRSFMHSGEFTTLDQVVGFYDRPPPPTPGRDPLIQPRRLNPGERASIVAFLQSLTDPRVATGTGPFSRPTLLSEREGIGANQFGFPTFGVSGSPQMISEGPAATGLSDFRVGMHGGLAGAPALFGLALQRSIAGTQVSGVPVYIDDVSMLLTPVVLNGSGAGTFQMSIPADPVLMGLQAHGQWFVPDPNLFYLASRGASWTVH